MTGVLIWIIGAASAVGGIFLGLMIGKAEGKKLGKMEGARNALADEKTRVAAGRAALAAGRDSGLSPADRLRRNDGSW